MLADDIDYSHGKKSCFCGDSFDVHTVLALQSFERDKHFFNDNAKRYQRRIF